MGVTQAAGNLPPAAATTEAPPILRARRLRRSFRMGDQQVVVLRDVDLTLREGEFVAIEGRSGSGKSTLLHILGALDGVDDGTVEFRGQDYTRHTDVRLPRWMGILSSRWFVWLGLLFCLVGAAMLAFTPGEHDGPSLVFRIGLGLNVVGDLLVALFILVWSVRAVRAHKVEKPIATLRNTDFGFVFQFYHLLPELNVLENTLLTPMVQRSWLGFRSRRAHTLERAHQVLTDLGLAHRLKHRPSQLSGGERQRVAIARALMNNPRVLFADEPTGNLDVETGRQIMNLLEKLHQEQRQTIVMVTHDRALAREADRVLVLKDGKLEKAE